MKYLDKYDIVTCNNNDEYIVCDSILLDGDNFVYLVKKENPEIHMISLVTKDNNGIKIDELDLSSKENKKIIEKLLVEFGIDMYKEIKEVND